VTYGINEIFYSIQGEGVRAGTANVFIRFAGCNLRCRRETEGFDCDTEWVGSRPMTAAEIVAECSRIARKCGWVILTGGEPLLQADEALARELAKAGYRIAVETNGTEPLGFLADWVCVSPKTAEHTLRIKEADEVKYVRRHGQALPKPSIVADHRLLSPAFDAGRLLAENLQWCIQLVRDNPEWRLSVQVHQLMGVR
jgi:7-carboxy-7-deazaguanine synthase